jgi:GAF domain-containing protein
MSGDDVNGETLMTAQAVPEWKSEIQGRRSMLLSHLLMAAALGGLVALVLTYVALPEDMSVLERWIEVTPFLVGWLVSLVVWRWRGLGERRRAWIVVSLAYVLSVYIFRRGGLPGSGRVWLLLLPALAFVLLGRQPGLVAGLVSVLTYAVFTLAFSREWIVPLVIEDPTALETWSSEGGSFLLMVVVLTLILWSFSHSWLEALAGVDGANRQLRIQARDLEETNERLHRQAAQLQATTEVARAGSSILNPESLLVEVVERIEESFSSMGVYYVGIFLLDEAQRQATLRAATGEAGQLMLEMGYRLEVGDTSTIGWCIAHQQACITSDVGDGTVRFDALAMPHTRSEIALPLRSRGRVLGAMSVQSTREAAFDEADIAVLQTMADQVAVAIDNARLFSQLESVLEELQAVQQRYLAQAWKSFLTQRPVNQVEYTQPGADTLDAGPLREARQEAMASGQIVTVESSPVGRGSERDESLRSRPGDEISNPIYGNGNGSPSTVQAALVVPLKLRGQVIGTMTLQDPHHQRSWEAEDVALAEAVAEQVALTVENLRLMDEAQRRVAREQMTLEITDKMRRAASVEDIVRTAVDELADVLGTSRTFVRMETLPAAQDGEDRAAGEHKARPYLMGMGD